MKNEYKCAFVQIRGLVGKIYKPLQPSIPESY